jgi:hypothetical protein
MEIYKLMLNDELVSASLRNSIQETKSSFRSQNAWHRMLLNIYLVRKEHPQWQWNRERQFIHEPTWI